MKTVTLTVHQEPAKPASATREITFPRYGLSEGDSHDTWWRVAEDGSTVTITCTKWDSIEWEIEFERAHIMHLSRTYSERELAVGEYESTAAEFYGALDELTKSLNSIPPPVVTRPAPAPSHRPA